MAQKRNHASPQALSYSELYARLSSVKKAEAQLSKELTELKKAFNNQKEALDKEVEARLKATKFIAKVKVLLGATSALAIVLLLFTLFK